MSDPSRTVYCLDVFPQTILSSESIGFALRPGVFSPREIRETSIVLETSGRVSSIFVPDMRIGYESLEITSSILTITNRVGAGTGGIRILEQEPLLLTRSAPAL